MKRQCILVVAALLLVAMVSPAWAAGRKLDDQELDQVAAGDFTAQVVGSVLDLSFDSGHKFMNHVSGTGTITLESQPLLSPGCNAITCYVSTSNVNLGTNAQQGMSSFVNVIAVNSLVNVLTNFNITILSGSATQNLTLTQGNLVH
jgi:hypothetical protein